MELILAIAAGFLILCWQLPNRILKKLMPYNQSYVCLFQKKILISEKVTQENPWHMGLVLNNYTFVLSRKINLSFPPQIAFSISELIDLSDNEDDFDRISFSSGKIENVNWNNYSKKFECNVAIQQIDTTEKLGAALVNCMVEGWILEDCPSSISIAEIAIKTFLTEWKIRIENAEKESQKSLSADWEHLEKVQKILLIQKNLQTYL